MLAEFNTMTIWRLEASGPAVGTGASASDLIGELYGQSVEVILIPVWRLDPEFFRLQSGLAGEFIQKLQNYGFRVAIVGDISVFAAGSALRDFVAESNRRGEHVFARDEAELAALLRPR